MNLNRRELIRTYWKQRITEVPKGYESILNKIQNSKIKDKYIEDYKVVVTYDINDYIGKPYSKENFRERDDFLYSLFSIVILFDIISKYNLEKSEKDFIILFMENIINEDNKILNQWRKTDEGLIKLVTMSSSLEFIEDISHGLEGILFKTKKKSIKQSLENITFNNNYQEIKKELENTNILFGDTLIFEKIEDNKITYQIMNQKKKEEKQKTLHELLMG